MNCLMGRPVLLETLLGTKVDRLVVLFALGTGEIARHGVVASLRGASSSFSRHGEW